MSKFSPVEKPARNDIAFIKATALVKPSSLSSKELYDVVKKTTRSVSLFSSFVRLVSKYTSRIRLVFVSLHFLHIGFFSHIIALLLYTVRVFGDCKKCQG